MMSSPGKPAMHIGTKNLHHGNARRQIKYIYISQFVVQAEKSNWSEVTCANCPTKFTLEQASTVQAAAARPGERKVPQFPRSGLAQISAGE